MDALSIDATPSATIPFRDTEARGIVQCRPEGLDAGVDVTEVGDHHCPFLSLLALRTGSLTFLNRACA